MDDAGKSRIIVSPDRRAGPELKITPIRLRCECCEVGTCTSHQEPNRSSFASTLLIVIKVGIISNDALQSRTLRNGTQDASQIQVSIADIECQKAMIRQ